VLHLAVRQTGDVLQGQGPEEGDTNVYATLVINDSSPLKESPRSRKFTILDAA
jgi:hypothetical protein